MPSLENWFGEGNGNLGRPYRPELFMSDRAEFELAIVSFQDQMDDDDDIADPMIFERVVYTIVTWFCLCRDMWKPKCRMTPCTFFEVFIGWFADTAAHNRVFK